MKKLRIAIIAPISWRTPPRKQGAWELVASNITEELVRRGHNVTLYATGDSVTAARLRTVVPHPLLEDPGLEGKVYEWLHAGAAFEDAGQFDVIHNHADGYPLAMSRLVRTPVVNTVHGFSSPQIKEIYRRYDNVAHVSISLADRRNCPDMNWAANIYHGVDTKELKFAPRAQGYYGFIGRVHPTKGLDVAIAAAKRAGVELRIAGHIDHNDANVTAYWTERVEPELDGQQIRFVGEIGGEDKAAFIGGARAILCPVQWEEPFGMVFIESMSCGTPVVAFGRGSVPEIIKDGVGGIVVPAGDVAAMADALPRAAVMDRQAVRDYAVRKFSIARMVDDYETLYRRVISG